MNFSLLEWGYKLGIRCRHFLYDQKWLSKAYAPIPVVSIGNLVAGGAGKTQVTLFLAQALNPSLEVAILSRGYLGKAERAPKPLIVNIKKHSVRTCGDEPWMIANRLDRGVVIVNKNRFKSALAADSLGMHVLILDDGMQHRKLHRDYEIVVIDGENPFGNGRFLPAGELREDPKQLEKADLIFYIGSPSAETQEKVRALTAAPSTTAKIMLQRVQSLDGTTIDSLSGKTVGLFCGIGNPLRFVKTVEANGARVAATCFLRDHNSISEKSLRKFASISQDKGAELLLCTEKDKVKLPALSSPAAIPVAWVEAQLEILENLAVWERAVSDIKLLAGKSV